jgi:ATPase family protein associated with various cellular activities (AAA)
MSDAVLAGLRTLRRRAQTLLAALVTDLQPFRHETAENGFRRKPDSKSIPNDVNVTTTCSCLMALSVAGKLRDFYGDDSDRIVQQTFENLLNAPWMSSGLAENNAFTTSLVLRTLGFLRRASLLPSTVAHRPSAKLWEPQLTVTNATAVARRLLRAKDPLSEMVLDLLPWSTKEEIKHLLGDGLAKSLETLLRSELGRLVRTSYFYDRRRFSRSRLGARTRRTLGRLTTPYAAAQLNRLLVDDFFAPLIASPKALSLAGIAKSLASRPKQFGINEYASSAAVIYWFVDGIERAGIALAGSQWESLTEWASDEFGRQSSLVVARHAAMMDPVAMAMAACLCARLRSMSSRSRLGMNSSYHALLPSVIELEQAILELCEHQTRSGIWPKYFPLFHYQEAGSNFCFTFELLEAILNEFGGETNRLIEQPIFVDSLERAVMWCERNRLHFADRAGTTFTGWNSGGSLDTLQQEQPESWATGVVHMFLWELVDVLSRHIQKSILTKYGASRRETRPRLTDILDIKVWLDSSYPTVQDTLRTTIVAAYATADADTLRAATPSAGSVSALLFGPPGTSKTEIARALAAELNWPFVQIDPSHFLQSTFQNIYVRAEEIFEDVTDLAGVVILFDELDALVQKRDPAGGRLDTESTFLTTYMLPKLARLHDLRRVVFVMAANFQENFDDAIKRAGRFDLLLCVGPPSLEAKCERIHLFFGSGEEATTATRKAGARILKMCGGRDRWLQQQLALYTFGDFKTLIRRISPRKDEIYTKIRALGRDELRDLVKADSKTAVLQFDDLEGILNDYRVETVEELDTVNIDFSRFRPERPVIRFVRDRKQSRQQ